LNFARFRTFLFGQLKSADAYGLVATRLVIAAFWVNAIVPRWIALANGKPVAHPLVTTLFGSTFAIPLTYLFTVFETLGAVSLALGLAIRLACIWGVAEFIITGFYGVAVGSLALSKDLGLLAGSFRLLLSGSHTLTLDRYLANRRATPTRE
jgi:uncharacterized membrane protein YphA (DoxX/SURF4 family)